MLISFKDVRAPVWKAPEQLTPVEKVTLEQLLKKPVSFDFVGLGTKFVAVLKVPKGWKMDQFECQTGYVMIWMLGPLELHKQ